MIRVFGNPAFVQEWPITGWSGMKAERAKDLKVKISVEIEYEKEDREVVNKFLEAYKDLMAAAVFKDSGNPVVLTKVAQLTTADGRHAAVPASNIPQGMLVGATDGDEQQHPDGKGGQSEGVFEASREDVREAEEGGRSPDEDDHS
jgi:hypothetical protein